MHVCRLRWLYVCKSSVCAWYFSLVRWTVNEMPYFNRFRTKSLYTTKTFAHNRQRYCSLLNFSAKLKLLAAHIHTHTHIPMIWHGIIGSVSFSLHAFTLGVLSSVLVYPCHSLSLCTYWAKFVRLFLIKYISNRESDSRTLAFISPLPHNN